MPSNVLLPTNGVTVIRGTSHTLELTVVDEDDIAVDLTGARVLLTVKRDLADPLPLIQKTSDTITEVEITSPKGGIARIYLAPADTQTQDLGTYVFDVWAVLASGKRYAVVEPSDFIIEAGVTIIP